MTKIARKLFRQNLYREIENLKHGKNLEIEKSKGFKIQKIEILQNPETDECPKL